MTLAERISAVGTKPGARSTDPSSTAPRLTVSAFAIDHRGELIKEMRADADTLDKHAAEATHRALSLRIAADHLEAHPPEP